MIVQASLCHGRSRFNDDRLTRHRINRLLCRTLHVVLGSVNNVVAHELTILQGVLATDILVVIHVNDRVLVLGVHMVVVKELGTHEGLAFQLALQLGVLLLQDILVPQLCMEEVTASLNVGNAGLPIDIEQVDTLHSDITEAVQLGFIPNHLIHARAGLDLLPHGIGIGAFEMVLFKNTRDNGGQHTRLALVAFFTG